MNKFLPELGITLYQKWHVVPYEICGVRMYAVESGNGQIYKYCNTEEAAQEYVNELADL